MAASRSLLAFGLDCSTQGLKASLVDVSTCASRATFAVNYDRDLPEFRTTGGVHKGANAVVTSPSVMFSAALDKLLGKMKQADVPFDQVVAVSGSGQQHGSVYWKQSALKQLQSLKPSLTLKDQLDGHFSFPDSPIWMDSSTTAECRALEKSLGGAQALATLTGSRAYERFTAAQIMKRARAAPAQFAQTERISLISSFMCSLLLGNYAGIDHSDASGMNLMSLKAQEWSQPALDATAPNLRQLLGPLASPSSVQGQISPYFVSRYGFSPACRVVTWSGDNPNSVAGLGLRNPGDVGLSLGTSDTIFCMLDAHDSTPGVEGHVFVSPVSATAHMAMLCYKNGSLSREAVCKRVAGGSWDKFKELVEKTPPGNKGNIGFYIDEPEIIPFIPKTGVRRFDHHGNRVDSFPPEVEARAVLESQLLSMRVHTQSLGLNPTSIIATGGASVNACVTQVIADVFGTTVKAAVQPDSASLGAAYRAVHAYLKETRPDLPFSEAIPASAFNHTVVSQPRPDAHKAYTVAMETFRAREASVIAESS